MLEIRDNFIKILDDLVCGIGESVGDGNDDDDDDFDILFMR